MKLKLILMLIVISGKCYSQRLECFYYKDGKMNDTLNYKDGKKMNDTLIYFNYEPKYISYPRVIYVADSIQWGQYEKLDDSIFVFTKEEIIKLKKILKNN